MRRLSASRRRSKESSSPMPRSRSTERQCDEPDGDSTSTTIPPDLRRCESDYLDSQKDAVASVTDDSSIEESAAPTLPRYPVLEQRNKNCWSVPAVEKFAVRGPTYLNDKKKVPSGPYLLEARGLDLFLNDVAPNNKKNSSAPIHNKNDNNNMAQDLCSLRSNSILGGHLRKTPTLAVIFRFPWGYMNLYFEIPAHLAKYLSHSPPPLDPNFSIAEQALVKWFLGDADYRNQRLKLIPFVAEGPWVVRNLVTGRPTLIGTKLPVQYHLHCDNGSVPLLTATLDIGPSISATAKKIVSVCRRYMNVLTVDIGLVIQAEEQEELPEQMLGAVRVHGPDPLQAPKLH